MLIHIELFQVKDQGFTVIVGEKFASHLTVDEALGVVASTLFAPVRSPMFVRTYEEWHAWETRMGRPSKIAGLLERKTS